MGEPVSLLVVSIVCAATIIMWVLGSMFFRRYSRYVVYWL